MAEEKKDETKQAQAQAESKTESVEKAPPRKKKINQMTASEIDAKLKLIQDQQGGLRSKYAKHLQERKKSLLS